MTVQQLIDMLNEVEDKSLTVVVEGEAGVLKDVLSVDEWDDDHVYLDVEE